MTTIATARLELIAATPPTLRAALTGADALADALGAGVPTTWPPDFLDAAAFAYTLERLAEGDAQDGWWMYFVVQRRARALIGSGGYKGPPTADGTVEIGYGIVADRRRQGYASETADALIAHAFAFPGVTRVVAETLPELEASLGVMRRCRMRRIDGASEPGVVRHAIARAEYHAATRA